MLYNASRSEVVYQKGCNVAQGKMLYLAARWRTRRAAAAAAINCSQQRAPVWCVYGADGASFLGLSLMQTKMDQAAL
jgi:hypothetical protein